MLLILLVTLGTSVATGKPDRIYYMDYRKDGKRIQEKAGRQSQDVTPARAARIRVDKIKGRIASNKEQREARKAAQMAEESRYTVSKLWTEYKAARPNLKGWKTGTYDSIYNRHVNPNFGDKEPKDILPLDVKRFENRLLKTLSPQMVKHVLKQLRVLCNFGSKNKLCPGLSFTIEMPVVDNIKTEDLTQDQMDRLLKAIKADTHPQAGPMMLMSLYSGMRRGEMFRLEWRDIDFEKGFIHLRDPKNGKGQTIPLNKSARALLLNHPRLKGSPFVFQGRAGHQRTRIDKAVNVIKKAAGLPKRLFENCLVCSSSRRKKNLTGGIHLVF
jgi:integrase